MRLWVGLAAALLLVSPVRADEGKTNFSIGEQAFVMTLPEGYCVPTGRLSVAAEGFAKADDANETTVTYFLCDELGRLETQGDPSRWGMVKTPRLLIQVTLPYGRKEAIDSLRSQIDEDLMRKLNEKGGAAAEALTRALGQKVDVKAALKPLDADDNAAYIGGVSTLSLADGKPIPVACVGAITVAKGKMVFLYLFKGYDADRDILELLSQMKAMAADFVAENGG